jgi:DNA-binding response OmpR family regulator
VQRLPITPKSEPIIALADPEIDQLQDLLLLFDLEDVTILPIHPAQSLAQGIHDQNIGLMILDLSFADNKGLQQIQLIRQNQTFPIIVTGYDLIDSIRLAAFEMGADEVVQKPYQLKEMVFRVKAMLKRTQQLDCPSIETDNQSYSTFSWNNHLVQIDILRHGVQIDNRPIELTGSEWEIFILLLNHPGHVFSRNQLTEQCLGYSPEGETRTIDTHMANLRTKLCIDGLIETIRGYGYRMVPLNVASD